MKKHFYKNIQGWFSFEKVYTKMVKQCNKKAHFVEVGAWKGQSTAFLAVLIANSDKKIKLDVVDHWLGSENERNSTHKEATQRDIFEEFKKNLEPVIDYVNPVRKDSVTASKDYKDNSLDFVYIDADHRYEFVKADIDAWYPKVKKGGYIGGHDYEPGWAGVVKAVDEKFGDKKELIGTTWLFEKTVKS